MLNLNLDLPYRTTPRRCSQGSPVGWIQISLKKNRNRQILFLGLKSTSTQLKQKEM